MIGVRAVSDIIGFKRDQDWTGYACIMAAATAKGLMVTIKESLPSLVYSSSSNQIKYSLEELLEYIECAIRFY